MKNFSDTYEDMVSLPHHVSSSHPHMPMPDRAAQFSPFAALTGYEAAITEASRLTNSRVELDENAKSSLNEKLQIARENLGDSAEITVTYFVPDEKKEGGEYVTACGKVCKIDTYAGLLTLEGGITIPIREIIQIDGGIDDI